MRSSDHRPHLLTLMFSSGITFSLASSCWVLSGMLPSFMALLWDRGTRLGNVSMQRVGMGLMSFVFARVWVMP